LNWKEWARYIKELVKKNPSIQFVCLLGGDISVWGEKLVSFSKRMKEIFWNFTTNGVLLNDEKKLKKLRKEMDSISLSLDSLKPKEDVWERLKSQTTIKLLPLLNKLGFRDLHCTITIDKTNLEELPDLVKFLTKNKTWAEITPVIFGKNKNYDYAASFDVLKKRLFTKKDIPKIKKIMLKMVEMKKEGYLIHNTDNYLLNWSKYVVKQQWKCGYPINLVFDADGSARLCLHVKGKRVVKHNIKDFNFDDFLKDWYKDFKELCKGCYWNCQYEPKYIYEKTKDLKDIKDYFNHKVKYAEKHIKEIK